MATGGMLFCLRCFDEHPIVSPRINKLLVMTKTKSQKLRQAAAKASGGAQGAPRGARQGKKLKRWEFNLIKTGNVSANYMSGNSARSMISNKPTRKVREIVDQPGLGKLTQVNSGQIIEQDEFIGLVNGSETIESTSYSIQPGLAAVFPWGSKVANLYERYSILDVCFYYKPTVSPFAVGGQQGKMVLSIDYDAAEGPPTTIQEAETMDPHADGLPYENISLCVDPSRATPAGGKFIRPGPVAGTDIKTYDAGNLYVTAAGTATSAQVGELRVRYRISFSNPRLSAPTVAPCRCLTSYDLNDAAVVSGATLVNWVVANNPLGIALAAGIFTLPPGHYVMSLSYWLSVQAPLVKKDLTLPVGAPSPKADLFANSSVDFYLAGGIVKRDFWASDANADEKRTGQMVRTFSVGQADGATSYCNFVVGWTGAGATIQVVQTQLIFHMV